MVRWFDWLLVPLAACAILWGLIYTITTIVGIIGSERRFWDKDNEIFLLRVLGVLIIMALSGVYLSSI